MKRIITMTAMTVVALGLFVAPSPAEAAPSDVCRDGTYSEVQLVDDPAVPAYLAVDYRLPDGFAQHAFLCFKDRSGTTNIGGYVHVAVVEAWESAYVTCDGDLPATVALWCIALVDANTTDQLPGPGTTTDGYINVQGISGYIAMTGAETGATGVTTTGTYAAEQGGACAWFLGTQLMPGCSAKAVEAHAEPNDVVGKPGGTGGVPVCVGIYVGGSCLGTFVTVTTNPTVTIGDDPDQSVGVTVLGFTVGENIPYTCIGTTAPC